jgi:hypothetical protein
VIPPRDSLLSGEVRRGPVWLQASESVLCSLLSGEVPWVAFAPVADGPMECDVPHLSEDPVGLLVPLCCKVSVVLLIEVTIYMWIVHRGHQLYVGMVVPLAAYRA